MTGEELDTLAQVAYAAYGQSTGGKNFRGEPMPNWAELPPAIREAWRMSSDAVRMFDSVCGPATIPTAADNAFVACWVALARQAYESFAEECGRVTNRENHADYPWDKVTPEARAGWVAAVRRVVELFRKGGDIR